MSENALDEPTNPLDHLTAYVDAKGGRPAAAEALGIPYPTFASICNGYRGISRAMADKMAAASDGALDAGVLIWVKATKAEGASKAEERVA